LKLARTKEWRESHGLTQRELAAEAGVGEATVARIEAGASVTPPTARKIAEALGVAVADLLERPPVPLAEASQETGLEDFEAQIRSLSDIDELRHMALELKAEWNRLGVDIHERAVSRRLSDSEYHATLARMEEIEHRIAATKKRAHELRKKLDEYEAEGVFAVTA
jgi:transcriptional regulator with XRE-family HTH domain